MPILFPLIQHGFCEKNKLAPSKQQLEKALNLKTKHFHKDGCDGKFLELPILAKRRKQKKNTGD
jgi:hypothetical protein